MSVLVPNPLICEATETATQTNSAFTGMKLVATTQIMDVIASTPTYPRKSDLSWIQLSTTHPYGQQPVNDSPKPSKPRHPFGIRAGRIFALTP